MSDIEAPLKYSEAAADKSAQDGSIGLLVLLALGLAFSAVALAMLTREAAEPFVLAILGGLAVIGVFSLFAGAVGILHFGERQARDDITKALADNHTDGLLVTDGAGSVLYANAAYLALTGAEGARKVPTLKRAFADETQLSEPVFRLMRAARQGRGWREDVTLAPASGDAGPRWLRLSVRHIAPGPKTGKRAHLQVWQIKDISGERAKEEDAFAKLQQMVGFLDRAPAGFISAGKAGEVEYLNATLARWLDLELAEAAVGEFSLDDIMSAEAADLIRRAGDHDEQRFEIDLKRRDGTRLPVRLVLRLALAAEGEGGLAQMLVLQRESETRGDDAQASAISADLRSARFFQSAPIAIATVNGDGLIGSSNAAFARMFDANGGERDGAAMGGLIGKEGAEALAAAISAAKSGKAVIDPVDVTFGKDDERNGRIYISGIERANEDDDVAIVYAIDTTEQRALEMQIAQSQKMQAVGQLAGGIAHDFNNVLTAIIGFSELLLANHRPTDPAFQDIMNIRQNANRAAALVRQLLAFSRQQTLQPEVLKLGDVLAELTILLGRLLGEKIDLNVVHGRDLWKVKADLHQFEQVDRQSGGECARRHARRRQAHHPHLERQCAGGRRARPQGHAGG